MTGIRCRVCGILLMDVDNEEDAICGRCVDECLSAELSAGEEVVAASERS